MMNMENTRITRFMATSAALLLGLGASQAANPFLPGYESIPDAEPFTIGTR